MTMRLTLALLWLALALPGAAVAQNAAQNAAPSARKPTIQEKRTVPATATTPEYIQLARNVEIIPNIEDAVKSVGVLTHEGVFGPLIFAEKTRAFFLELKPGMYLDEHPHDTGSIVYTVRGRWVLASEGKRHVMQAGTLFRFGDRMPTGWEAPFEEGALLLILKTKKDGDNHQRFADGTRKMKVDLEKERAKGMKFYYHELPPDHPAIAFARSVSPKFDEVLKLRY